MDTQHLTTSAAAEIACNAGVKQLIPFHFSKRYAHNLDAVYEEIRQAAGPVRVFGHQERGERKGAKRSPDLAVGRPGGSSVSGPHKGGSEAGRVMDLRQQQ